MARVLLVHWNEAEARARAGRLRAAGHRVDVHWDATWSGLLFARRG